MEFSRRRTHRFAALFVALTFGLAAGALIVTGAAPGQAVELECAPNLLVDGDFGTLPPGQTANLPEPPGAPYFYSPIGPNFLEAAGAFAVMTFDVSQEAHSTNRVWENLAGHTTGADDDAYLGVNGSTAQGIFFQRTFNDLFPGVTYDASAWAINAINSSGNVNAGSPNFGIRVRRLTDNVIVAQAASGPLPETNVPVGTRIGPSLWHEVPLSFTTSTDTSVNYRIEFFNVSVQNVGNDFSVDDLSLAANVCPGMTVVKSGTVDDVNGDGITDEGDTVDYSVEITNTGTGALSLVEVQDELLAARGITMTCTPTTLAETEVSTCTANEPYVITAADAARGTLANTATGSSTSADGRNMTEASSFSLQVLAPRIRLDKTVESVVDVDGNGINTEGDQINYAFLVENTGTTQLTDVRVSDPLLAGDTIPCTPTTLAPQGTATCTPSAPYTITAADVTAGVVDNTATANGIAPSGGTVQATDRTSTPVGTADAGFELDKRVATVIDVNGNGVNDAGDQIVYEFELTNTGNLTLTDLAVSDPMLGDVICPDEPLLPGQSRDCTGAEAYTITSADVAAGGVANVATATAEGAGGILVRSASAETFTPVEGAPTDLPDTGGPGLGLLAIAMMALLGGLGCTYLGRAHGGPLRR